MSKLDDVAIYLCVTFTCKYALHISTVQLVNDAP
jgi:hypothetical protein